MIRIAFIQCLLLQFFLSITNAQALRINELQTNNSTGITDNYGNHEDWIELYNDSSTAISLKGFGLSDDVTKPFKWVFPNVSIQSKQYLVIWLSDKTTIADWNNLHTNFSVKSSGEPVILTSPGGKRLSQYNEVALEKDLSYGCNQNNPNELVIYTHPTPGSINIGPVYSSILSMPEFSKEAGFYSSTINLELFNNDSNVVIVYTLDGSDPDTSNLKGQGYVYKNSYPQYLGDLPSILNEQTFTSFIYDGPITIKDRTTDPNKISMILTTFDKETWWFPQTSIYKGTVVKARAYKQGAVASNIVTRSYFVSPLGTSRFSLPIVSISIQENKLFDFFKGIYVAGEDFEKWRVDNPTAEANGGSDGNYWRRGDSAEVTGHLEIFDLNKQSVLNESIGFRINGNWSRSNSGKSLRFCARNKYGLETLNYRFFPSRKDSIFDNIILRCSGSDWNSSLFRDALVHGIVAPLGIDVQAYQPTISFINGEYWGIFNFRERHDKYYFKRTYNIEENEYDLLEWNSSASVGNNSHYLKMLNFISANTMAIHSNYLYIQKQMDVENFIDYEIAEIYINNWDWPGNNIKYWRYKANGYQPSAPYRKDGRWRWMMYDTDLSMSIWDSKAYSVNSLANAMATNGPDWPNPPWSTQLLRDLCESDTFQLAFVNRFADLMNTAFTTKRILGFINEYSGRLLPEIDEHIDRWQTPYGRAFWDERVEDMRTFATNRPTYLRNFYRQQFSLGANTMVTIDVSNKYHGRVKVNTIMIDSLTLGIDTTIYPWKGIYFKQTPIRLEAIPTDGYSFAKWDGISVGSVNPVYIDPANATNVKAVFVKKDTSQSAIHELQFDFPSVYFFNATVTIQSFQNELVSIDLLDMQGRYIMNICKDELVNGQLLLPINTSLIAEGVYLLNTRTLNSQRTQRIVIKR